MDLDFKKINSQVDKAEDTSPQKGDTIYMFNKELKRQDIAKNIIKSDDDYIMEAIVIMITNNSIRGNIKTGWVQFINGNKVRTFFNNNYSYDEKTIKKESYH